MCSQGLIDRYVNFYTDFAFKKLFGSEPNKDLLISFLNALLQGRETIEEIEYLNAERLGTQEYDRRAVFDVYCKNDRGEMFIVEMQKAEQQFFKDRSVYYSTFAIREQAPRGAWNYELKGVYVISFLNFRLSEMEQNDAYYHEVKLMHTEMKTVFYEKLTFIYLEMPKFTKTEDELETLFDKWLYAIRHLASLMERPAALQEKVFVHLFEAAEIAKFNRTDRCEYEESLKNYRDWFSVMQTARLKSHAEGHAEGLAEGRAEGRAEGLAEGKSEAMKETVLRMKALNMPQDAISQVTGLSIEEIERIS